MPELIRYVPYASDVKQQQNMEGSVAMSEDKGARPSQLRLPGDEDPASDSEVSKHRQRTHKADQNHTQHTPTCIQVSFGTTAHTHAKQANLVM